MVKLIVLLGIGALALIWLMSCSFPSSDEEDQPTLDENNNQQPDETPLLLPEVSPKPETTSAPVFVALLKPILPCTTLAQSAAGVPRDADTPPTVMADTLETEPWVCTIKT